MGKNKKHNNAKMKDTVVKEKDIIKESDYEDYKGDNKKIIIVALILALLIGGFAFVRSMDKPTELPNEEQKPNEEVKPPVEVEEEEEKEEEKYYYPVYRPVIKEEEKKEEDPVDVWEDFEEVPTSLEAGSDYLLPEFKVEDEESEVVAVLTYKFKSNEEGSEYLPVTSFDTTKIGSYLVTYTLDFASGIVETKEVEVEIVDTTEPIVNNISNEEHFKDKVVLDITEYSPYKVELNGVEYDEALPIEEEGEYTLVVTEDIPNGQSIEVKFVIDKTLPEITGVEDKKHYKSEEAIVITVDDLNMVPESVLLTKDGIEHEFESGVTELLEEGVYVISVSDKAGNKTEYTFVIDRTAPELEVVYTPDNSELTDSPVSVVITGNEKLIGIDGWTLSEDGLTLTKEFAENETLTLEVKDLAENITKVEIVVDYIDYTIKYSPKLTLENLVANKVKATIISLEELIISSEGWTALEVGEDGLYKYEKIYDTNGIEVVNYENSEGAGTLEVNIEITLTPFVEYVEDALTGNVTAHVTTTEEVLEENLPEGWTYVLPIDPEAEITEYKYYKEYTESVDYEVVEFITENKHYVATIMIDMDAPVVEAEDIKVEYTYEEEEPTVKESVEITITADEEIEAVTEPEKWTSSEDNKSISQVIEKPTENVPVEEQVENVTIKDASGNETTVEYSYNWN